MSDFPQLRTGAVAQYPAQKGLAFSTVVARFVDGSEQRSRSFGTALRRWVIRLDLVDEGEVAAIDAFFANQAGSAGVFAFTDPWDGTNYPNCSLAADDFGCTLDGPARARTRIVIRENR